MKKSLIGEDFDTFLESSDWRYSAAIVGMEKFFNYFSKDQLQWRKVQDGIYYNYEDLTEERFLEFVEYYFIDDMHHKELEKLLMSDEFNEDMVKQINEKMKANSIMKKVFKNIKFDGNNSAIIQEIIEKNRKVLIKDTFKNKNNLYKNYCNTSSLLQEKGQCCRLVGYSVDMNKKGKSISYNFDKINYVYEDEIEMDFLPMGFSNGRQGYFINSNSTVENLIRTNSTFNSKITKAKELASANKDDDGYKNTNLNDSKKILFNSIINTDDFINYDVEVIMKNVENDFFETIYIRDESIKNLKKIKDFYDVFMYSKKISDGYWIDIYDEVINCILNNIRTDKLIEIFIKSNEREYMVSRLISVNLIIENGGKDMEDKIKSAYGTAKNIAEEMQENKLMSYKHKLASALIFRDYDRYCDILMKLSTEINKPLNFAFDLFEDFEGNKDVAYSFVNALSKKEERKSEE